MKAIATITRIVKPHIKVKYGEPTISKYCTYRKIIYYFRITQNETCFLCFLYFPYTEEEKKNVFPYTYINLLCYWWRIELVVYTQNVNSIFEILHKIAFT